MQSVSLIDTPVNPSMADQTGPSARPPAGEVLTTVTCPKCNTRIASSPEEPQAKKNAGDSTLPKPALVAIAMLCGFYLVVPTAGVFELIPDFIPFVGSLDEAGATAGLIFAASQLGWLEWLPSFIKK